MRDTLSRWIVSGIMFTALLSPLFADDLAAIDSATIHLAHSCNSCHGPDGVSSGPSIPSIAGLPQEYFTEIMLGFKLDQLPATVMGTVAKGFERGELAQLAAYYANKPFIPATQSFDQQLAKKGAKLHEEFCEECHEKGGSSAKDKEISILAGQHLLYLRWTLDDLKRKKRVATRKMAKKMRKLLKREGNAGLDALVHYYASQQ